MSNKTTIRELLVAIGVDAGDADKQVERLDNALGDLKDVMLGIVATGAAVTGAILGVAVSAADAAGAVADGAARVGLSAKAYQELAYQAGLAGASTEQLEAALIAQNRAVQTAIDKGQDAIDVTDSQAISLYDFNGQLRSQEELLYAAASAVEDAKSETEALGIATTLYGEAGIKLLPMLKNGKAGMRALSAEADSLGLVMSDAAIATGDEFGDTLDTTIAIVTGLKNAIGLQLAPVLTDLMVRFRAWYDANRKVIDQKVRGWIDGIIVSIRIMEEVASNVNAVVMSTIGGWGPVFVGAAVAAGLLATALLGIQAFKAWSALNGFATVLGVIGSSSAVKGIQTLGYVLFQAARLGVGPFTSAVLAMLNALDPVTYVVAAVAALAAELGTFLLLGQDLLVFLRGGDSVISRFQARMLVAFPQLLGALLAASRLLRAMIEAGSAAWDLLKEIASVVFDGLISDLSHLVSAFMGLAPVKVVVDLLRDAILGLVDAVARLAPGFLDGIAGKLQEFTALARGATGTLAAGQAAAPGLGGVGTSLGAIGAGVGALSNSAGFAPSGTAIAGVSRVPVNNTRSTTIQGNTYQITGVGLSKDEAAELIRQSEAERARATAAALEGGEV